MNLDQWFRRCCLKIILIWSSGGPFVQRSGPICAILVKGMMRNNSVKLFELEPVVQKKISSTDISYQELWQPFCSVEGNHLCNFGRRHHEEQFCEIIWNLDEWFRRCCLKIFLIWSSGGPFSAEQNHLCNFGRGYYEEQFCETLLKLDQWFRR